MVTQYHSSWSSHWKGCFCWTQGCSHWLQAGTTRRSPQLAWPHSKPATWKSGVCESLKTRCSSPLPKGKTEKNQDIFEGPYMVADLKDGITLRIPDNSFFKVHTTHLKSLDIIFPYTPPDSFRPSWQLTNRMHCLLKTKTTLKIMYLTLLKMPMLT